MKYSVITELTIHKMHQEFIFPCFLKKAKFCMHWKFAIKNENADFEVHKKLNAKTKIHIIVDGKASLLQPWCPRREAGDVWCLPPVWNLRAVIWFPFPILLFFCLVLLLFLSCHFSVNGPFSWLLFQKTLKYFSLRVRLFCMALVEQLGDDSW